MTICCPLPEVPLWSLSEGFLTGLLSSHGSRGTLRWGLGERLESDLGRATTDRPPVWLTGTREEEDEEGCWLLLWLVKERRKVGQI